MKKPAKTPEPATVPFSIRLSSDAKAVLDREAKAQGRPTANLAQWIIVEWLRKKELLK
jgi:predicted DNA-binding protein